MNSTHSGGSATAVLPEGSPDRGRGADEGAISPEPARTADATGSAGRPGRKASRKGQRRRAAVGLGLASVLAVGGGLALWGATFTTTMVHDQLTAQRIVFPPKGSDALDPAKFPGLQRYAGQTVDNGPKAKAFANQFIGTHLKSVAGGKTYAEVSGASRANPGDPKLAGQKSAMFEGETLRGLLLSAWGWSVIGSITGLVAYGAFAAAAMVLAALIVCTLRARPTTRAEAEAETAER